MQQQYTFRPLDLSGVSTLISWAEKEGWNPGLYDAYLFYHSDPQGFYGYYHNDLLIGGGSLVSYQGLFGFMGLFILQPGYRNAGLGRNLWHLRKNTLLARLRYGASIGMDGVQAMQPFYAKGGFIRQFSEQRFLFQGAETSGSPEVVLASEVPLAEILQYDTYCFGFDRASFAVAWLQQPGAGSFVFREGGVVKGYAVVRPAVVGYKIGPLFADTPAIAEQLLRSSLHYANGQQVMLDVPLMNDSAVALAAQYNGNPTFECARMYCGAPVPIPLHNVFGITTLELG
ncbi:MAG: GNAT family N-acetyltransferase [Chitinophagia bacterium]|nr:GNAT family N-acetyltransferase [Chitinophagia bacterium]